MKNMKKILMVICLITIISSCAIQEIETMPENSQNVYDGWVVETFPSDSVSRLMLLHYIQSDLDCIAARCIDKSSDNELVFNEKEVKELNAVDVCMEERVRRTVKGSK